MREKTQQERWESKIKKGPGCWEWIGSKTRNGYGQFHFNGRSTTAIRVSVILSGREIPKDGERMAVDHLCKNRGCVNPEHLEVVTYAVNATRQKNRNNDFRFCVRGHEFTPENTGIYRQHKKTKRTFRICKKCAEERRKNTC